MDIETKITLENKILSYCIYSKYVDHELKADDFDYEANKTIFKLLPEITSYNNEKNYVPIEKHLRDQYFNILNTAVDVFDYNKLKNQLLSFVDKRESQEKVKNIFDLYTKNNDINLISDMINEIKSKPSRSKKSLPIYTHDDFEKYCNTKEENFITFNRVTGKELMFYKGALSFVVARPANGKTALLLSMAIDVLMQEKTVIFITYEQSPVELIVRMMSQYLSVLNPDFQTIGTTRIDNILKGLSSNENQKLIDAVVKTKEIIMEHIRKNQLLIMHPQTDIKTLEEIINVSLIQYKPHTILIDYIQKITNSENQYASRQSEIANTSNRILQLAIKTNLPIVLGAQLNRGIENRKVSSIQLSDIRESGDIEQDANLIIGLRNLNKDKEKPENKLMIDVIKNRNGKDMTIDCDFNPPGAIKFNEVKKS